MLLASVEKTVQSALNALQMATRAVSAHTDLLKTAMDVSADYLYLEMREFLHARASIAIAHISYGNSVCLFVCPS